jgi:ComF family protein
MQIRIWLNDILNLFYPHNCHACGDALSTQENIICLLCESKLPRTGFHMHADNPIARVFWGRVKLEDATSFLFFNKGGHVQELMHALKYKGKKETGVHLGKLFGLDLKNSPSYQHIDTIIPVPLHPKKLHKRGFNQSYTIAKGIGKVLDAEIDRTNLIRIVNTESQTKKSRYNRWENVKGVFGVINENQLKDKHILLVDDVLTTGATLEACASVLLDIENTKVSVATLAYAQV